MSSFFKKGQDSSRSASKKAQRDWDEATTTWLQQHWYCSGIVLVLFQFLVLSGLIHKFRIYSCMYHFNRFNFVELSFICDACGVTLLFQHKFCLMLLELITSQFILISIIMAYSFLKWQKSPLNYLKVIDKQNFYLYFCV